MSVGLFNFFIKLSFLFVVLLTITQVLYYRFFRLITPVVTSGCFVLGAGAFLWLCLPEFGLPHFIMQIAALELAIIWVYLILGIAQSAIENVMPFHCAEEWLALGSWVAGTAIIALLLDKVEPLLHGSILFLAMVANLL